MVAPLLALLGCPVALAESLPVTVGVSSPATLLRAGPGDDFYPTDRLSAGTPLEVWAIDESGYCAVRPPAGSYSWVRAADVIDESGGGGPPESVPRGQFTGVVVSDGAIARVGSRLNDLRHVTQVALEAGERVQVVERVTIAAGRHAGEWLRIEPPAGEFRWAWGPDLALPPALAPAVERPEAAAGLAAAGEAIAAIRDAGTAVTRVVAEVEGTPDAGAAADSPAPGLLTEQGGMTRLLSGWLPRGTNVFDLTPPPASPPRRSRPTNWPTSTWRCRWPWPARATAGTCRRSATGCGWPPPGPPPPRSGRGPRPSTPAWPGSRRSTPNSGRS